MTWCPPPGARGPVFIVVWGEPWPVDQIDVTGGVDANPRGVEASGEDWRRKEAGLGRSP